MLKITPHMRILVAVEAVDFRKSIDSLAEMCCAKLDADSVLGILVGDQTSIQDACAARGASLDRRRTGVAESELKYFLLSFRKNVW